MNLSLAARLPNAVRSQLDRGLLGLRTTLNSSLGHSRPDGARTCIKNANSGKLRDNAMGKVNLANHLIGLDKWLDN